jgi:hypothetical protein
MTSVGEYQLVQNGGDSGLPIAYDPTSASMCAMVETWLPYTRVDVLYQGYFVAFPGAGGIGRRRRIRGIRTSDRFRQKGGSAPSADLIAAATLAEMATRALKAAWFHKWIKDLRMRPEEYGALVHARKAQSASPMPHAQTAALPNDSF